MRADEYALIEVKQDELFNVKNFFESQLAQKSRANATFLVSLIYKELANAIRSFEMNRLKSLVDIKLTMYGISLKDLPFRSTGQVCVGGKNYIPPLELAAATRNFLAFSFLLDSMFNSMKSCVMLRPIEKNLVQRKQTSVRIDEFSNYLSELREAAEENEIYELIDILDNFDEDKEIAAITDDGTRSDFNKVYLESLNLGNVEINKSSNRLKTGKMIGSTIAVTDSDGTSVATRLKANLTMYHQSVEFTKYSHHRENSTEMEMFSNKLNSKLCAIL